MRMYFPQHAALPGSDLEIPAGLFIRPAGALPGILLENAPGVKNHALICASLTILNKRGGHKPSILEDPP